MVVVKIALGKGARKVQQPAGDRGLRLLIRWFFARAH